MRAFGQVQMQLAGSRSGRILLHLLCACRDGKLRWHGRGVAREFPGLSSLLECPSRVGRMAGFGENLCVRQNPPHLFSEGFLPIRERFGLHASDTSL
jgi:hypothetical protein